MLRDFVFAAMAFLQPDVDHTELGTAIASVVSAEAPLFTDDDSRERTASLVVAVAFRESSLRLDAVGDQGRSVCAMQIWGGPRSLLSDADACIRTGLAMLRTSFRTCPKAPIAWYAAGGPNACAIPRAIRISNDRLALARRVHAAATRVLLEASST